MHALPGVSSLQRCCISRAMRAHAHEGAAAGHTFCPAALMRTLALVLCARSGARVRRTRYALSGQARASPVFKSRPSPRGHALTLCSSPSPSCSQGNPKKIVILGTRHCTFLHQQIVELLSYALVLSGNHVFTSGAIGTHTAVIRGALRAENQSLLTVILPQTLVQQPEETRALLAQVEQVHSLGHNDLPLSVASRLCNSELLTKVRRSACARSLHAQSPWHACA